MSTHPSGGTPLRSELSDDPEMVELIELFIEELPNRIEAIGQALSSGDWSELSRLAHQLRGAGAGYGFEPISDSAASLEDTTELGGEPDLEAIRACVSELAGLCVRATAG